MVKNALAKKEKDKNYWFYLNVIDVLSLTVKKVL